MATALRSTLSKLKDRKSSSAICSLRSSSRASAWKPRNSRADNGVEGGAQLGLVMDDAHRTGLALLADRDQRLRHRGEADFGSTLRDILAWRITTPLGTRSP